MPAKYKGKKGDDNMIKTKFDVGSVDFTKREPEPIASIVEMGNRELIKKLVELTQQLMDEKIHMLDVQTAYQTSKEELQFHIDIKMHDIASAVGPDGKKIFPNEQARASEFATRREKDTKYNEFIEKRNACWHRMKTHEITIEKIQNDILNIRAVLKL